MAHKFEWELAETVAEQYENDTRVEEATAKENGKGVYVQVVPQDKIVAEELKNEVDEKPVFVKFSNV